MASNTKREGYTMSYDDPGQKPLPHPPTGPRPRPTNPNPVDFGDNVVIFDPSKSMSEIQSKTKQVLDQQQANQFGTERIAFFFKPGTYDKLVWRSATTLLFMDWALPPMT
jgi:hypothetical protein